MEEVVELYISKVPEDKEQKGNIISFKRGEAVEM